MLELAFPLFVGVNEKETFKLRVQKRALQMIKSNIRKKDEQPAKRKTLETWPSSIALSLKQQKRMEIARIRDDSKQLHLKTVTALL